MCATAKWSCGIRQEGETTRLPRDKEMTMSRDKRLENLSVGKDGSMVQISYRHEQIHK